MNKKICKILQNNILVLDFEKNIGNVGSNVKKKHYHLKTEI